MSQHSASEILKYFSFQHLPPKLRVVSRPFHDLAVLVDQSLSPCEEKAVALRKLLEAKDAAVRAGLFDGEDD